MRRADFTAAGRNYQSASGKRAVHLEYSAMWKP